MQRNPQAAPAAGTVQFKLVLPRAVHEALARDAKRYLRSVGAEIRERLQRSVEADEETRRLIAAIAQVAGSAIVKWSEAERIEGHLVPEYWASWHEDPKARALFRAALDIVLDRMVVPRPTKPDPAVEREGAYIAGLAIGGLPKRPTREEEDEKEAQESVARVRENAAREEEQKP